MTTDAGRHHQTARRLSLEDLASLPPTVDLRTAAQILGIGRTAAYALVRAGHWPTPVVRAGRLIRVPTAPLLQLLGICAPAEETTQQYP
jgi:predicted DNA-binding transcriptional regulator AlpA